MKRYADPVSVRADRPAEVQDGGRDRAAGICHGQRTRYAVARAHWSVHFNVSPDGTLFAGDGGGPSSVAAPGNGQWIYLFTPGPAGLVATPLVDLSAHDYALEPNVTFTPDGRWLVFRSNMHGAAHVYAVEIARPRTP